MLKKKMLGKIFLIIKVYLYLEINNVFVSVTKIYSFNKAWIIYYIYYYMVLFSLFVFSINFIIDNIINMQEMSRIFSIEKEDVLNKL